MDGERESFHYIHLSHITNFKRNWNIGKSRYVNSRNFILNFCFPPPLFDFIWFTFSQNTHFHMFQNQKTFWTLNFCFPLLQMDGHSERALFAFIWFTAIKLQSFRSKCCCVLLCVYQIDSLPQNYILLEENVVVFCFVFIKLIHCHKTTSF